MSRDCLCLSIVSDVSPRFRLAARWWNGVFSRLRAGGNSAAIKAAEEHQAGLDCTPTLRYMRLSRAMQSCLSKPSENRQTDQQPLPRAWGHGRTCNLVQYVCIITLL